MPHRQNFATRHSSISTDTCLKTVSLFLFSTKIESLCRLYWKQEERYSLQADSIGNKKKNSVFWLTIFIGNKRDTAFMQTLSLLKQEERFSLQADSMFIRKQNRDTAFRKTPLNMLMTNLAPQNKQINKT